MESRETGSRVDENSRECVTLERHLYDGTKTPLTLDIYMFGFLSRIAISLEKAHILTTTIAMRLAKATPNG